MRIKIRIYNPYDLDIIALSEAPHFSVANAMKQTLKYYAAGKRYLVEIPTLTETLKNDNYVKGFYVELDDVADKQAIDFLMTIPDGQRNSFMKSIFRASFEVAPISLYMGAGGADYVEKMINNPRYGKYPVQREVIDPVILAEGEVGVTVSDDMPDVSKLPQGKKVKPKTEPKTEPKKPKTSEEMLRDVTQKAYQNSEKKKQEQLQRREDYLNNQQRQTVDKVTESDIEDLLDSMMG